MVHVVSSFGGASDAVCAALSVFFDVGVEVLAGVFARWRCPALRLAAAHDPRPAAKRASRRARRPPSGRPSSTRSGRLVDDPERGMERMMTRHDNAVN
jgi:hypothetical protein